MKDKINVPIYPQQKSPQMFKNKILERLTRTHPLVIVAMYLVLSGVSISYFYRNYSQSILTIIGLFLLGYFLWTLGEYCMHRFLFHHPKDASFDKGIQYTFHGIHHEYPDDTDRTVLPVIPSLGFAALFFGLFWLIMGPYALLFAPGFVLGYTSYMTVHYSMHRFKPPKSKIFSFWWTFHNIHHFQQHDRAFGVTTSLWDRVFGTMPEEGRRTVEVVVGKKTKIKPAEEVSETAEH